MIDNEKKIKALEKKLDKILIKKSKDSVTSKNNWKPRKLDSLHKKAMKKPEYVLVQYLRNNHTMGFQISRVISGNIVVIGNKGHSLNPKLMWRHGRYFWYIVGEWDKEPIGPRYLERIKRLERGTDNHPILIKMVLGAVQKKEEIKSKAKIGWIVALAGLGLILWLVFSGG